ncbi:MAG: hypothetical protein IT461_10775 [Planctomycetes bacterium]|jgi:hypothetical protein|nr:hypothetical protein [Planctomycetota bacterium]
MPDDEYEQAQKRLREAAELRKRLADEAAAEHEAAARAATEETEEEAAAEEEEDDKADDTRFMSADAKLTHLPLHWAIITLCVCLGISFLINQVDGERMRQALTYAKDKGQLSQDDADLAERGISTYEKRQEYQKKLRGLRERRSELADRARHILEGSEHHEEEEKSGVEKLADMPLTIDDIREYLQEKTGSNWERYRNIATAFALVLGGLGLVVAAYMVRIAGAVLLGAVGATSSFVFGLDPMISIGVGLVGALIGSFLAPRLLLASIYSNAMFAGVIVGGIAGGGSIYLGSGSEGLALLGLGVGALLGAMIALKFARQFYLCSVLANTAGLASFVLWVVWGEQFPYFSQITFGGLMVVDGLLTRLYHKVRY